MACFFKIDDGTVVRTIENKKARFDKPDRAGVDEVPVFSIFSGTSSIAILGLLDNHVKPREIACASSASNACRKGCSLVGWSMDQFCEVCHDSSGPLVPGVFGSSSGPPVGLPFGSPGPYGLRSVFQPAGEYAFA